MIEVVTLIGGLDKSGVRERCERLDLNMGDVVSVVGPTGSGKTQLINDLELMADGDTPSGRRVLINNAISSEDYRDNPANNPVAMITQHTTFLSDMIVKEFLACHCGVRGRPTQIISDTISFANELCGEPIDGTERMMELSGGQTRSLLIADASVICDAPIVLVDEVELAGIDRWSAIRLLKNRGKIFMFVTHDPRIALMSDYRIVMSNGGMSDVIKTSDKERECCGVIEKLDNILSLVRETIRGGGTVTEINI